jgi:O-antigen ligase
VTPVTVFAGLYVIFCAASLFAASDVTLGAFEVLNILERFLLYVYIVCRVRSREDILFIVRIALGGLIIQTLLMLAQIAGIVGTIDWYGVKAQTEFFGDRRVSGTLGSPNPAAAYLAMYMVFAFGILLSGARQRDRYLSGAGLLLAIVPLLFTLSRGGWLSSLVGMMIVLFCDKSRANRRLVAVTIASSIVLVTLFIVPVEGRLFGDDHGSAASRLPLNELALAMIEDHPLVGVGANNFSLGMRPYLAHSFSGEFIYTVHNCYLRVWAETGLGGLIAFVSFMIAVIYKAFRTWQMQDNLLSAMALGCAAAVTGSMVQMTVEPFRGGGAGHCLWLFGGLVVVMYRLSVESSEDACARKMSPLLNHKHTHLIDQ